MDAHQFQGKLLICSFVHPCIDVICSSVKVSLLLPSSSSSSASIPDPQTQRAMEVGTGKYGFIWAPEGQSP